MNRRLLLLPLLLLLLPLGACKAKPDEASTPAPDSTPHEALAVDPRTISPKDWVPGDRKATPSAGLDFDVPSSWPSQPPSSGMRLAQAVIPGPGGSGEFAVFFFGSGDGGSVQANLSRWSGQMDPKTAEAQPETFETNGLKVTWIDVQGTLQPSGMGLGPTTPQPNSRLLGAVVEGPGGPWFFKATGPDATLGQEKDNFLKMLRSARRKK
jgi:hypothetical protein